ncbi:hypothetical protein BVY11_12725 [Pseudomonas amygdali pv. morsprunorum]|uniref:Uncharacterized protein n=2 Tax=Pseudomonas syringae TaxID=317 RepID=A0A2K4WUD8_PSESX|nr:MULTISPECIES: hypothetical protein [Pseudomonas syringae group]AVB15066.1 hypothetical protein BKM19_016895 [Pseudomonas amygdali pv. morsprunorum]SOS39520.1 hypothetical protein CFBP3840_02474 [Pseudomonas syringae]KPW95171.1 Uncharacterized protein ALO79_01745 [Pseudomonas syringae pv. castaneae]KWS49325.1 hypothetical protein AL056_16745 [Pseudomonas amygdali pv. morsprunorum]KWS59587.1 hypothetical protein AL054_09800 [Pseudomonas amygdali pv. morsprunorum]
MSFSNFNYAAEWFGLVDRYDQAIREKKEELWSGRFPDQHLRQALGDYKLKCFAERMRKSPQAIWKALDPHEALRLYLINKHHWHPDQVRAIDRDDQFLYLLRDELVSMRLTSEEAAPVRQSVEHWDSHPEFYLHLDLPTS